MYFDDRKAGMTEQTAPAEKRIAGNSPAEIPTEAYNQNGEFVLTNVTEAIVKCKAVKER